MSVKAMSQVWELDLPHNQLLVLLAMADHADHEGGNIYPSIGRIAWKVGYSERQVQRVIKEIVKSGILELVQERVGETKVYRLNVTKGKQKSPYNPNPRQNVTPDTTMSPYPRHSYVTPTPDTTMSPKPSIESSEEPKIADYAALQENKSRTVQEKAKPYYDAIVSVWDIHKGQNSDMQKMLEGKATKNGYAENNMTPPVTLDEFLEWSAWAKRELGTYMVKSPAKVASSITSWRQKKSKPIEAPKSLAQRKAPTNLDILQGE